MKLNPKLEAIVLVALAGIIWFLGLFEGRIVDDYWHCIPLVEFPYVIYDMGYACAFNTNLYVLAILVVLAIYHKKEIKKFLKKKKKAKK
ncbi:hypothetical protein ACFLQ2_02930 [archaeon]